MLTFYPSQPLNLSLSFRFGSFWLVLARFGSFFGSFWLVLARFLARFGSFWLAPSFSKYAADVERA